MYLSKLSDDFKIPVQILKDYLESKNIISDAFSDLSDDIVYDIKKNLQLIRSNIKVIKVEPPKLRVPILNKINISELSSESREKKIKINLGKEIKEYVNATPRLMAAAKEFNISKDTLVEFLISKGFNKEVMKPTSRLTKEMYQDLQSEFSRDKAQKIKSINTILINSDNNKNQNVKNTLIKKEKKKIHKPTKINPTQNSINIGATIDVVVERVIFPSQIITDCYEDFCGRLSVLDISWCLPNSEQLFKKIKIGDRIQCVVLNIDFKNKQVQLSQKHLVKPLSESIKWERIDRGDEYNSSIIEELNDSYIVKTDKGIYGLLHKSFVNTTAKELKVKVNSKLDYSDLISFVPAYLEVESESEIRDEPLVKFSFIEDELHSFNKFKRSLLGTNASDKQCEIIQSGFDTDERIFSKEFSTKHTLYIQFELNSPVYEFIFKQQVIPYFTDGSIQPEDAEKIVLDKLSKENYWFKINERLNNRRDKSDEKKELIEFSLFNEQINILGEVKISKNKKECKFVITRFTLEQTFAGASNAKKRNAKDGCYLFSNQLRINNPFATLPFGSSQTEILEYALLKAQCFSILNELRLDAGEILKQEGRTLAIIDKFLEYQISLIDEQKENNVYVDRFQQIPSQTGGISIKLPINIANSLELTEETIVNIRLKKEDDLLKLTDGILSLYDDGCKITFYKEINLELLQSGFYIDKRISKRQFQIQREIIQEFLEKKIKLDHIEYLLVHPDKIKTPIIPKVEFHNQDLVRTEKEQPDNNQILAVKKAIGNQNVFLIQGPPGTGKTTVIAEIIDQLVKKGEKILVSGQNHVSVDNVLSKIANITDLNLLRVGNPDRIDKDLVRYNIDNLVADYKGDYLKFISNQLKLTEQYLILKNSNLAKEIFSKKYLETVNELTAEYGRLKEVFKQRHFNLRDSLNELTANEIIDSIVSLRNWIDSNNNDYEILLKPLIYNSIDVVFATCIGIKSDEVFKDSKFKFDTVIIDEAGKANIAETLVAIELGKKVILVGDQMQLPPYMDSSLIDEKESASFPKSIYGNSYLMDEIIHALKTSFFEFIIKRIETGQFPADNKVMLNYQHRMHPNIGKFVSESFYDGLVLMGSKTHLNRIDLPAPFNKEVIFFDTSNSANPFEQNDGYSAKNNTEAEAVSEIILPKLFEHNVSPKNIAVIAPYKSQVANIQHYIKNSSTCNFKNIDISTLDSFQGKEYDIIIFSFTRSSNHRNAPTVNDRKKYKKVGFLDDARRLNVAFSRAKKKLIFVGNAVTLIDGKSHYDGLFNYTKLFNKLVELSKNEEIGRFVNMADYSDFKSPFDAFTEKYKVNDFTSGIVEEIGVSKSTGNKFGLFIMVEGIRLLAPYYHINSVLNKNFTNFHKGTEVVIRVVDIDFEAKKIVVQIMEDIWYKNVLSLGNLDSITVEIFKTLPNGFLVKTSNGIVGLLNLKFNLHTPKRKLGDKIKVILSTVDFYNKKVKFKFK